MPEIPTLTKTYEATLEPGSNLAADEVISLITSDRIDRDGEVVLTEGIDLTNFRKNPVVMYGHAKGLPDEGQGGLPVGRNLWIKPSRDGKGLVAKTKFDFERERGREVGGQVKSGFLNSYSITFIPRKSGPPTREELARRPDWKGAKTIYRECELVEYSVVALPANPDAVTLEKTFETHHGHEVEGIHKPPFHEYDDPDMGARNAEDEEPDADDIPKGEDEEPIKRGDHVRLKAPHVRGVGKCMSVHKGEMVPDVEEDLYGSKEEPAVRVRMYKAMGDGHAPTSHHVGCLMKHLEKIDELRPPTKREKAHVPHEASLPPHRMHSDTIRKELAIIQSAEFKERLRQLAADRLDLMRGRV